MTTIHLNDYTKAHLAETVGNLQMNFNTHLTSKAPIKAVIGIYDALLNAVRVCKIDQGTRNYIVTMVRCGDHQERPLNQYIHRLKKEIRSAPDGMYSADFALRSLLAVLRDGYIADPDDVRPFYAKILGVGKMSDYEKRKWEEAMFEPVALKLIDIVSFYYQSRIKY
jgi:hypothetical protein